MGLINKKSAILYILEVLKDFSDANHALTYAEIINKLYKIYGIECERKSVATNIDSLCGFGYDIVKVKRGGCYLNSREFTDYEISYLIDSVFSSRNIDSKHAKDLSERLAKFLSAHDRKRFNNHIYKADDIPRTVNNDFFLNIAMITDAIDNGKKIEFIYNIYGIDKKLKSRSQKLYVVSPYFMTNNNSKYYLVCEDGRGELVNYRIDFMTKIAVSEEKSTNIKSLKNCEKGVDITKYIREHVYMFSGDIVDVNLKLSDEWAVSNLYDWYGKYAKITKVDSEIFASIKVSERAVIYWALQYGEGVEILEPMSTRMAIADKINMIAEKYK